MKISTEGMSRLVFIFDKNVVKIPWINIFKVFNCIFEHKKENTLNGKIKRFHSYLFFAIIKFGIHILLANKREYDYYLLNKNEKSLLKIKKAYFFGFILIQPKGEVLNTKDKRWKKLLSNLKNYGVTNIDLLTPSNFCVHKSKIKLLDYGSDLTQIELNKIGFKIFKNNPIF